MKILGYLGFSENEPSPFKKSANRIAVLATSKENVVAIVPQISPRFSLVHIANSIIVCLDYYAFVPFSWISLVPCSSTQKYFSHTSSL